MLKAYPPTPGTRRPRPPTLGGPTSTTGTTTTTTTTTSANQDLRNFHTTAAGISRDIAHTSALLSELSKLVQHHPQPPQPHATATMNQLVIQIKSSIENLNTRLDQAARQIAKQKKSRQAVQQAANLVDGLQTEFAQQAADFKKVLQRRTAAMKEQDDFEKQVYNYNQQQDEIPNMSLSAPPPVYSSMASGTGASLSSSTAAFPTLDLTTNLHMSPGEATGSSLPRPHGIAADYSGGGGGGMRHRGYHQGGGGYSGYDTTTAAPLTPLDIQRMEEESGLQMQLVQTDYLQQRADAMSTVETQMVELGTIFNKLAVMVSEHGEMVQRVDDNVQDAELNINMSMNVLTDTLESLRTNRMLALRVFSVLVAFIIAFIIFAA